MKSNTKKLSLKLFAIIATICFMVSFLAMGSLKTVSADENSAELGASKFSISTTEESILFVTPLTGDISKIYEVGYTFEGDQPEILQADETKYYTTLVIKGVEKHANDLFGNAYSSDTPMIIWEVENNPEHTYTATSYYYEGKVEGDVLYPTDTPVTGTAKTAKICTVTYMDEETVIGTEKVAYGLNATASSIAGFTYDWSLDNEDFDLTTAITENITLKGENKTLKEIDMWDGCTTTNAKENLTIIQPKDYVVEFSPNTSTVIKDNQATKVNALKYQESVYASSATANGVMNWGFDFTSADVAAWKAAGYDWLTFFVYAHTYNGAQVPRVEYSGSNAVVRSNLKNGKWWNPVVISLDDVIATTQWKFVINCGSGHYVNDGAFFKAGVTHPQLMDSADRPVPVLLGSNSNIECDKATFTNWEYGKQITANGADGKGGYQTPTTKTTIVYQEKTATTIDNRVARLNMFAGFTADYITQLKSEGYTKVTYYLYLAATDTDWKMAKEYIDNIYKLHEDGYRTDNLICRGYWSKIEVSLDKLLTRINESKADAGVIYTYLNDSSPSASNFAVAMTQPVLEK